MKHISTHFSVFKYHVIVLMCLILVSVANRISAQLPHPDHIIIVIEENHSITHILDDSVDAPYINQIAREPQGVIMRNMYGIEHPSQPNYLDLFSGANQGVTSDNPSTSYPFTTPNLARQLLDKGLTFVTYSESLPFVGSDTVSFGSYVRKHNPVTNWVGTGTNQVPDTLNQPFTSFPSDYSKLPTVCYVVANEDSDMHTGSIQAGDFWLKEHFQPVIDWISNPANNSLLFYTFDEDDYTANNNIPAVFYGPVVKPGVDSTTYNHYSVLRTIEDIYGLGYAGAAQTNSPITDCWQSINAVSSVKAVEQVICYPNPTASLLQFRGDVLSASSTLVELTDVTGRTIAIEQANGNNKLNIDVSAYCNGIYFYKIVSNGSNIESGKVVVQH